MEGSAEQEVRVTRRRARADEWALVLLAEGLEPRVRPVPGGFAVCLPAAEAERGARLLGAWERENRGEQPPPEPPPPLPLRAALAVWAALLPFFAATGPRAPGVPWFERGSADAARILAGEPWRAVTALTLHADLLHALGNVLAGTLFFAAAAGALGPGVAGALVLLAGAAGNLANAALHGGDHVSVGASTAVFGAVGLLGGLAVGRRRRRGARGRRAWLQPVAAAVALLAMLGTSGERTDVGAHLLGLLAGSLLGIALLPLARPPGRSLQWACGAAALAALGGCWALALA